MLLLVAAFYLCLYNNAGRYNVYIAYKNVFVII